MCLEKSESPDLQICGLPGTSELALQILSPVCFPEPFVKRETKSGSVCLPIHKSNFKKKKCMYTNCAIDVDLKTVILRLGLLQQNKEFYQTSKSHYSTGSESRFFSGLEIVLHQVAPPQNRWSMYYLLPQAFMQNHHSLRTITIMLWFCTLCNLNNAVPSFECRKEQKSRKLLPF